MDLLCIRAFACIVFVFYCIWFLLIFCFFELLRNHNHIDDDDLVLVVTLLTGAAMYGNIFRTFLALHGHMDIVPTNSIL